VKQGGYWSTESLKIRSVLNYFIQCSLFPMNEIKNHMTCMLIVSFSIVHTPCRATRYGLWSFKRWRIDPSDCIPSPISCLSALDFSLYPSMIPSPIEICPSTRWEWKGGSVHTLSRLIGPIVTSHFLWWSNGQLPSLLLAPPVSLLSFSPRFSPSASVDAKDGQPLFRPDGRRSEVDSLILPSNHFIQRRRSWEFYPST
jgi:hypothetical protein